MLKRMLHSFVSSMSAITFHTPSGCFLQTVTCLPVETQKELARRLGEAEHIGDCLIKIGNHLKGEPWKYAIGWLDADLPDADRVYLVEREIEDAMDLRRLMWWLEDIRILRRRQTELKKLVAG